MTATTIAARWRDAAPRLLSVLRIFLAFIFLQAGTMKWFGVPVPMPGGPTAKVLSEFWMAGVLETVAGTFLLVGWFTRPLAFLLAGEMAVAYFQFFGLKGFWPIGNGGALPAVCCFAWLYISAAGPGPWSLDARSTRRTAA